MITLDDPMDRGNASGRATRGLLMETAERLFAERGIAGVSLREIGQKAGQRNNAATQYHFGNREKLIQAIYISRASALEARRYELMAGLEGPLRDQDTATLLDVILRPHVENMARGESRFVTFLAQLLTDRGTLRIGREQQSASYQGAHNELREALRLSLPVELAPNVFQQRYDRVFAWGIHSLAEIEAGKGTAGEPEIDELVGMLVRALAPECRRSP